MTNNDPAVRRTIARMRWKLRQMRHEHKTLCTGKPYTPSVETDIARTFRLYDYVPPSQREQA